jgi:hypothetical protein
LLATGEAGGAKKPAPLLQLWLLRLEEWCQTGAMFVSLKYFGSILCSELIIMPSFFSYYHPPRRKHMKRDLTRMQWRSHVGVSWGALTSQEENSMHPVCKPDHVHTCSRKATCGCSGHPTNPEDGGCQHVEGAVRDLAQLPFTERRIGKEPMHVIRQIPSLSTRHASTYVSVQKVVPTLTSTSAKIYLSMDSAKQLGDTSFILVPAGAVHPAGVCSRHCIALHRGACRGELQAWRERR